MKGGLPLAGLRNAADPLEKGPGKKREISCLDIS